MADLIYFDWTPSRTLYGVIRNSDQQVWNTAGTPAFQSYTGANWTDYDVAFSEQTTSGASGRYTMSMPAGITAPGFYDVAIYQRVGASPSLASDLRLGVFSLQWTGSAFATGGGDATAANQTTILNRLGSITGSGNNTVLGFFKALLSKSAPTPSDIGGTFDASTDSNEAIKDLGVAAVAGAVGSVTGNVGGNVTGSVGSVAGDVAGKVLGGGAGTITGTGARADDRDGSAIAKASSLTTVGNNVLLVLDRLGSFSASGVNTVLGFFQALMRSDASTPSDLGGSYTPTTDSTQAIRDRGDAAWLTGTPPTAAAIADAVLDEALSGHATPGTAGAALAAASTFDPTTDRVNLGAIDDSTLAAENLGKLYAGGVGAGSIDDATPAADGFTGAAGLSADDDAYNGLYLVFTSGPNANRWRKVTDYVGAT
ncbi:MAG TPA: hypothetical protein VGE52_13055, partial [Pirellulales bacterium]